MPIASNDVLDAPLAEIATCTAVHACSAEPATHAGIAAVSLGSYTMTAGVGGGDWTVQDAGGGGREIVRAEQTGNNGTATGAATYIAYTDGTTLHWTTEGDGDTINNGSPFSLPQATVARFPDPVTV